MSSNAFRLSSAEEALYLKNRLDSFLMIPDSWHRNIQKETGKSYPLAELILSRLIYAYRPRPVSKNSALYTHYFDKDLFQISYEDLAVSFCQTKNSVKSAVVFLEEKGLIKRVFKTVAIGGVMLSNVLFISLDFEKILAITDLKAASSDTASSEKEISYVSEISDEGMNFFSQTYTYNPTDNPLDIKSVNKADSRGVMGLSDGLTETMTVTGDGNCIKAAGKISERGRAVPVKSVKPLKSRMKDNGNGNGSSGSGKNSISFTTSFILSPDYTKDLLIRERPDDKERIDTIIAMICEGFSGSYDKGCAAGDVRELSRLEFEHVLDRLSKVDVTRIKNPRAYIYKALLNAKSDIALFGGGDRSVAGREYRNSGRYDYDELETRLLNAG